MSKKHELVQENLDFGKIQDLNWQPIYKYKFYDSTPGSHVEYGPRVLFQDKRGRCICGYAVRDYHGYVKYVTDNHAEFFPDRFLSLPSEPTNA